MITSPAWKKVAPLGHPRSHALTLALITMLNTPLHSSAAIVIYGIKGMQQMLGSILR